MTVDDRRRLDESGYLVFPAHLAISRELLSHLESLFEQAGENAGHAFRVEPFARNIEISPDQRGIFAPFTVDPAVLKCVERLLGPQFELAALGARSSNPFALALNPFGPGPGAPACRVLWMFDDCTDEGAAALRVVPGSHRRDQSPMALDAVSLSAAAGSAVVLDGRLWTGDAPNPGSRHLRTLRCEYIRRAASNSG